MTDTPRGSVAGKWTRHTVVPLIVPFVLILLFAGYVMFEAAS